MEEQIPNKPETEKSSKRETIDLEDTMESLNPISAKVNVIKTNNVNRGEEIFKLLSQAINVNDSNVVHEPACAVCSSPYRKEVEQKFLETKSLIDIQKLLKDKSGMELELIVFENHTKFHLTQGVRELQKIEYAQRIKRLYNQNSTTFDKIDMAFAVVTERIMGVNSIMPSSEMSIAEIEKIKCSETVKLMGQLTSLMKLQASISGEMKASGEIFSFPANEFLDIIFKAMQSAKTDREREMVKEMLDKFESLASKSKI